MSAGNWRQRGAVGVGPISTVPRHVSSLSHHTHLVSLLRMNQPQHLSFPEAHPAALDTALVRDAGSGGSTRDVRGDSDNKVLEFNVYKSSELGSRDDIITGEDKKVVLCVSATWISSSHWLTIAQVPPSLPAQGLFGLGSHPSARWRDWASCRTHREKVLLQ